MASDTRPGNHPEGPTPDGPRRGGPSPRPPEGDEDGTGVWDTASAWEQEDTRYAPGYGGGPLDQMSQPPGPPTRPVGGATEAGPIDGPYGGASHYAAGPPGGAWGPPRPASEEHWVEADWSARSGDYIPGEVTYYGPELGPVEYGPSAFEPEFVPAGPGYDPDGPGYAPDGPGYGPDEPAYAPGPATPLPSPPGPPGAGGGGAHGRGRRRGGPWPALVVITAVAVMAAAAILVVTTSHPRPNAAGNTGPAQGTVAAPGTAPSTTPRTTVPPRTTASATTLPSGSTTVSPGSLIAFSVPSNSSWEVGLVNSFVAAEAGQGISIADVDGEVPGDVEFAYMPSTATYWGLAEFQPSATLKAEASTAAGQAKLSFFDNTDYAFSWQDGKTWTLLGDVPTGDCPGIWVPRPVLSVWSLCGLHPPRTPPGG